MIRWPHGLYARLLIWFCVANIVVLLFSVFITERIARTAYGNEPNWAALAKKANETYTQGGEFALMQWAQKQHQQGVEVRLFEGERNLLARPLPPPIEALLPKLLAEEGIILQPRPGMRIVSERIVGADGVVRHSVAWRGRRPPPVRIGILLAVQIGLSLLAIGILGWWLTRSIAKPVQALQLASRAMASGDLSSRVASNWSQNPDELGALAQDFNDMAARIETLVLHERSVLQDLSHELRSPLTRLNVLLELAKQGGANSHLTRAEGEVAKLDEMIGEILALARIEADLPGQLREPTDIVALAKNSIAQFQEVAAPRGIYFVQQGVTQLQINAQSNLLKRALDNLLSNAVKFSPNNSAITVQLEQTATYAILSIQDSGPGVPQEELVTLFRPFFRGSNAPLAAGQGLGLTIVERIVRAHGGSVQAHNKTDGGLKIEIQLPL